MVCACRKISDGDKTVYDAAENCQRCRRQLFTYGTRGLKMEWFLFLMTNEPPYSPDFALFDFALLDEAKLRRRDFVT